MIDWPGDMGIKLLALDIDGTLITSRGELTERNREAIEQARQRGVHVVLVTGRRFGSAHLLLQELQLDLPVVSHNGALTKDTRTLETIRTETFEGDLPRNVSAHSKVDPADGAFHFFDYALYEPYYSYGVVERDNRLSHFTRIDLPGPRLPHDMAMTQNHILLMDLPVVFTDEGLRKRIWSIHQDERLPTRFGILAKRGDGAATRWFDFPPCYIYHVVNAWEEGDEIVLTACRMVPNGRAQDPAFGPYAAMVNVLALRAHLWRWRMNLKTGARDDRVIAFFKIGDAVRERGERVSVRTDEHLPLAAPDRERGAAPRGDEKIILARKDDREGEGPAHPAERGLDRVLRRQLFITQVIGDELRGDFRVRLRSEGKALRFQFLAQLGEILDDAVMDERDLLGRVRVGVGVRRRAMRRPARMADAGRAGEGKGGELLVEGRKAPRRAPAIEPPVADGRNAGGVITAIFKPLQPFDDLGRDVRFPKNADDAAHGAILSPRACALSYQLMLRRDTRGLIKQIKGREAALRRRRG